MICSIAQLSLNGNPITPEVVNLNTSSSLWANQYQGFPFKPLFYKTVKISSIVFKPMLL